MTLTLQDLQNFIGPAIAHDDKRDYAMSQEERRKTVDLLEVIACHKPLIKHYLRFLQAMLKGKARHDDALDIDLADKLANEGLSGMTDQDLIKLLLDPVSMWCLHEAIHLSFPDRWTDLIIRADECFLSLEKDMQDLTSQCMEGFPWDKLDLVTGDKVEEILRLSSDTVE